MTNKEIKLELAKAALASCSHMTSETLTESIKNVYEWIVEEPEVDVEQPKTDYDKISVMEIINHLANGRYSDGRYATMLEFLFRGNNINTIGDLLRYGRRDFQKIKGVGKGSVTRVDDALEELYGITNWYIQVSQVED